ncbi:hypothetical protein [Bradyrhizobium sp.]|uniref:hypothetical protein n=1 Tax=Bradyrhizobium sp. TaxID=376 RepID=UPI002D4EC61F|nr:hypothetical protein [Bradyrhizobium sp.]HZR75676.1 hypothetical protein [Bradyrhizobium sp.]
MGDREIMGTAAQEAIRIADTYLPRAPLKRRMALAKEIVAAIELCETELSHDIARRLEQQFGLG